jgi:hypothetical protein
MIITYEYTILTIPPSLYIVLYNHSCWCFFWQAKVCLFPRSQVPEVIF